jgi:hypothetical protein
MIIVRATLQWAESVRPTEVTSRTDLEARLRELAGQSAACPALVILAMPDGSYGYIGLGREESIIFLQGPRATDGSRDEWLPIGEKERSGYTEFFLLGQHRVVTPPPNKQLQPGQA